MFQRTLLGAAAGAALLLTALLSGCSDAADSTSGGAQSAQSQDAQSGQGESSAQDQQAQEVLPTEEKPEVDLDYTGPLPTITLPTKEDAPEMTPVADNPPDQITVEILKEGKGKQIVGPDDYIKVNYAGWLWDGEKFDSSFTTSGQATPISFSLNQVILGWKWGLAETYVGDQVMVVIPPEYGYGEAGTSSIPGGATLVFYVEILESVSVSTQSLEDAELTDVALPEGITVEGNLGEVPEVLFDKSAPMPESAQTFVIAQGNGPVVADDDAVEYLMTVGYWGSQERSQTWADGIGVVDPGNILAGEKVGSRILIITPAESEATPASFALVDILAAHPLR